jgi:hypothetical protein
MAALVITGLARERASALAKDAAANELTVRTDSDYDGALALQDGRADYYIGICQSGAGGALALAIALVGSTRAKNIAPAGKPLDESLVTSSVAEGVVAFGVALDHVDRAVPCIVRGILSKHR